MHKELSDKELWDQIRQNDPDALSLLFERYYFILLKRGLQIIQDSEILKDAINDVFYRLWLRRRNLSDVENIPAYLFTTYRNQILLILKENKKVNEKLTAYSRENETGEISYEEIIVRQQSKEEQKVKLQRAFDQLTPRQKEYLQYNFFEGLSYDQIADITGQSVKTIYNTTYEAIRKLRKEIIL